MPNKPDTERVESLYKKYGTVDAVVDELGLHRAEVSRIVDKMPFRQIYMRKGSPPKAYTRKELLDVLKEAAKICGEPLTLPNYHKEAPSRGWPAALTITRTFGTWENGCKEAGVKANPSTGPREGSYTEEDCLLALRICRADLIELGEIPENGAPSYERYVDWARANQQPSGPTVRAKIGPWREALALAYVE